jgi:hypothetical protein
LVIRINPVARLTAFLLLAVTLAFVGGACGSAEAGGEETVARNAPGATPLSGRYGVSLAPPAGWDLRVVRGAVHAATFPLPAPRSKWAQTASKTLGAEDALVLMFEHELGQSSPPLDAREYPALRGPLQLRPTEFAGSDGVTDGSAASGHGFARRLFSVSGRAFVLFVETGSVPPPPRMLESLNALLGRLQVEAGDFHTGFVEPAVFPARAGWETGNSGRVETKAQGDWLTAWASTIPYADEWNALPPQATLEKLPRDGIVIWVALERNSRFPPSSTDSSEYPPLTPPIRLEQFERQDGWEGQSRGIPQYVLWGKVRGQYHLDLRVFFGTRDPSAAMIGEADRMLGSLQLPQWPPWED